MSARAIFEETFISEEVSGLINPRLADFQSLIGSADKTRIRQAMAGLNDVLRATRERLERSTWDALCKWLLAHEASAILRSDPITRRSVERPRGYAGDAVLLDLIYDGWTPPSGTARSIDEAIHEHVYESPSCAAVRERREILARLIDQVADEVHQPTILAIAAGHLREADDSKALATGRIDRWIALDQDNDSLAEIIRRHPDIVETVHRSVKDIITGAYKTEPLDLAYAAGLYDYLPLSVARKLTRKICSALKPGGRFLFANFAADVFDVGYMECMMDWKLILRSQADMEQIGYCVGEGFEHRSWAGKDGSILYWEVRRKAA